MKEHPILFSTEMVQAILEGRKTQTRRIVKMPHGFEDDGYILSSTLDEVILFGDSPDTTDCFLRGEVKVKYKVGDILWVRETFLDGDDYPCSPHHEDETLPRFIYKADAPQEKWKDLIWKPSIFMPKEACRVFLEIMDIKVERLQDISEQDAIAEGIRTGQTEGYRMTYDYLRKEFLLHDPKGSYKSLWQSINGEASWKENPFVWVVSFKRIQK